jgi:hypothetical protein
VSWTRNTRVVDTRLVDEWVDRPMSPRLRDGVASRSPGREPRFGAPGGLWVHSRGMAAVPAALITSRLLCPRHGSRAPKVAVTTAQLVVTNARELLLSRHGRVRLDCPRCRRPVIGWDVDLAALREALHAARNRSRGGARRIVLDTVGTLVTV